MTYPHESKYKKEDNWGELRNCGKSEFEGSKSSWRESVFCDPVQCLSSLNVQGPTTLNSTSIIPAAVTVGGVTYVPTILTYVSGVTGGNGSPVIATFKSVQVLAAAG